MTRVSRLRLNLATFAFIFAFLSVTSASSALAQDGGGLTLSEVYPFGAGFVELHNSGPEPIELSGYTLTGDVQHVFAQGTAIEPGAYLVLSHSSRALQREFEAQVLVPEELWGRPHNGGAIRLFDRAGALVDWVRFPPLEPGQSYQRRPSVSTYRGPLAWAQAWPTPGRANDVTPFEPGLAIDAPTRTPLAPGPNDTVLVTARVHSGATTVRLRFENRERRGELTMLATPAEATAATATATTATVYSVTLPAFQGVVHYSFVASDASGNTVELAEDPRTEQPFRFATVAPVSSGALPTLHLEAPAATFASVLRGEPGAVTLIDADRSPPAVIEGVRLETTSGKTHRWEKPGLRVHLPGGTEIRGTRDFHLRTLLRDETYLREALAFAVYRRCGVPAPEARMVRVEVNGAFFGLYTEVETIDATFLARAGLWKAVTFVAEKGQTASCDGHPLPSLADYELYWKARADAPYGALRDFFAGLDACTDDAAVERFVAENLDADRYLRYLAANAIVSHWDDVGQNTYWCFDRAGTGKWLAIPWNVDRTFGDPERGHRLVVMQSAVNGTRDHPLHDRGHNAWDRVKDRVLSTPSLRERYYDLLRQLAAAELGTLEAEIDARLRAIENDAALDRARWSFARDRRDQRSVAMTYSGRRFHRAGEKLKLYVRDRARYLANACEEANAPTSRDERQHVARRELLSLAGLLVGALAYAKRRAA